MEPSNQKNSEELLNDRDMPEDINDIGLPKSSLHSFVKEILTKNKVRGDKNIIPMLDKISKLYVTHISSFGAKICTDSGKKTLNLEHILEALKQMQFNKHIERLVKDLKNSEIDSSKYDQLEEDKKNENKNLKQLINKKKKRGGRKKKCFEDENERDQMKKMQEKMFEEARNDMNKQQEKTMLENIGYKINDENNDEEDYKDNFDLNEDKEKKDEKGKDKEKYDDSDQNCCINNGEDDDINFD
jgi:histone H3/H4